jgi:hypothetical protein
MTAVSPRFIELRRYAQQLGTIRAARHAVAQLGKQSPSLVG